MWNIDKTSSLEKPHNVNSKNFPKNWAIIKRYRPSSSSVFLFSSINANTTIIAFIIVYMRAINCSLTIMSIMSAIMSINNNHWSVKIFVPQNLVYIFRVYCKMNIFCKIKYDLKLTVSVPSSITIKRVRLSLKILHKK